MNYQHNNNPGRLNKRITFLTPPGTENGWPSQEWKPYETVWAEIKTQKGNRIFNSDATQWQGRKVLGIRYRSDIMPNMRILIGETVYEIESLTNDDERNQWLTIIAKEVL